jgi:undecaprenyl-diphosphatase
VTISEGRYLGFDRDGATRLSFLMSLPIIAGAVVFKGAKVAANGGIPHGFAGPFIWGTLAAAVSGLLAITVLLRILRTRSFLPFVVYRFIAGAAVIVIFGTGIR